MTIQISRIFNSFKVTVKSKCTSVFNLWESDGFLFLEARWMKRRSKKCSTTFPPPNTILLVTPTVYPQYSRPAKVLLNKLVCPSLAHLLTNSRSVSQ